MVGSVVEPREGFTIRLGGAVARESAMSRNTHRLVACSVFCLMLVVLAWAASGYHILKKIPIATGEGTWDFGTIDGPGRRLFLAHETQVEVLNIDTGDLISTIADTKGAHGIALAPEFKHGFISNGAIAKVTMFDMTTLEKLREIPAGTLPDTIVYEPSSKHVFSFNTRTRDATVINASDGNVVKTL